MSRNRSFKERQTNRIDYIIMQEQAAEQMRQAQEQAEIRLQNELDALNCGNPNNTLEVSEK